MICGLKFNFIQYLDFIASLHDDVMQSGNIFQTPYVKSAATEEEVNY